MNVEEIKNDNQFLIEIKEQYTIMMIGNAAFAYVCGRTARLCATWGELDVGFCGCAMGV